MATASRSANTAAREETKQPGLRVPLRIANQIENLARRENNGMLNFIAGNTYELAVNQSTNATVRSLPEPASMALVGLSLLGVGFAGYRRNKKA